MFPLIRIWNFEGWLKMMKQPKFELQSSRYLPRMAQSAPTAKTPKSIRPWTPLDRQL
jgi:hypothetical protein